MILRFRSFCSEAILNFWETDGCHNFASRFNEFIMVENMRVDTKMKSLGGLLRKIFEI